MCKHVENEIVIQPHFQSEEGGSSSQHALQLINIHNHDFSQC